jgi:hypothetical protein
VRRNAETFSRAQLPPRSINDFLAGAEKVLKQKLKVFFLVREN